MLADLGKNSLEVWKDEVLDQSIEVNNLVYKVPFIFRYGHFVLFIAYSKRYNNNVLGMVTLYL